MAMTSAPHRRSAPQPWTQGVIGLHAFSWLGERLLGQIGDRLWEQGQKRPYAELPGYMRRGKLFEIGAVGVEARMHQILRSDLDRHVHDHPAGTVSVIFRGGYREYVPRPGATGEVTIEDCHSRLWLPGAVIYRAPWSAHVLHLNNGPSLTLFMFLNARSRAWGFFNGNPATPDGWTWWREYLDDWRGVSEEEIERARDRYGFDPPLPRDLLSVG